MRRFFTLLFIVSLAGPLAGQKNGTVKGIAFDTLVKQQVGAATITVLERKDSSLVTFSMTGADGRFEIKGLANGDYRLLISHVNYHNINKYFSINDSLKNADLGTLVMNDKTKVLAEVVQIGRAHV